MVSGAIIATLVVPLRAQGRELGGLCLERREGPGFDEEATQLAELCASGERGRAGECRAV